MLRVLLAAALTAVASCLTGAANGAPTTATLLGSVGPGFTISLKNGDGTAVTHLDPGSYSVNVDDKGTAHSFHLSGPGVDMATDIAGAGMVTWPVNLVNGTYTFHCDAHPTTMRGTFTVGSGGGGPRVPKLNARVTARAISLTNSGGRVRSLQANTYRVVVSDTTKKQNFHLSGPGVNRKTGIAAVVKTTWTVNLSPGTYVYRSDKSRKLRGTFNVTGGPALSARR